MNKRVKRLFVTLLSVVFWFMVVLLIQESCYSQQVQYRAWNNLQSRMYYQNEIPGSAFFMGDGWWQLNVLLKVPGGVGSEWVKLCDNTNSYLMRSVLRKDTTGKMIYTSDYVKIWFRKGGKPVIAVIDFDIKTYRAFARDIETGAVYEFTTWASGEIVGNFFEGLKNE